MVRWAGLGWLKPLEIAVASSLSAVVVVFRAETMLMFSQFQVCVQGGKETFFQDFDGRAE